MTTFADCVRSIRTTLPKPIREALRLADSQLDQEGWGTIYALRSLWDQWHKLPEAERRKLLNGWTDPGMPPTRREIEYSAGVRRFVRVTPSGNSGNMEAIQDWFADDARISPVHVMIAEGWSRAEVSAALHRLIDFVELEWNTLVEMRPGRDLFPHDYKAHKKSRQPEAATPTERQNLTGDRALTPAAA